MDGDLRALLDRQIAKRKAGVGCCVLPPYNWAITLAATVRAKMGAGDVLEVLYPLLLKHGSPEYSRSDNVL